MSDYKRMFSDPYYFRPLYKGYRDLIDLCGNWKGEYISGSRLLEVVQDHDMLRKLCNWNFLSLDREKKFGDNEAGIWALDFNVPYKITSQCREFAALEFNNIIDLDKGILILLRADHVPEQRIGLYVMPVPKTIGFYELAMMLDKSENSIRAALDRLEKKGLIKTKLILDENNRIWGLGSELEITDQGIEYLRNEGNPVTFNNINISNSTIGVIAIQSTLTNIDSHIGELKRSGSTDLAEALSKLTEALTSSVLKEPQRAEALEQVEIIAEEASKPTSDRKTSYVRGALALLKGINSGVAELKSIWEKIEPIVRGFFGL